MTGRAFALLALSLAISGCASGNFDGDKNSGSYMITVPLDIAATNSWIVGEASSTADETCPAGWKIRDELLLPSDLMWQIDCLAPPAHGQTRE